MKNEYGRVITPAGKTTYSVHWYKDPRQKLPSRMTVHSREDADDVRQALEDKGWQAWWTQDEG